MSILTLYYVIPVLAGLTVAFVVAALYYTFKTRKEQLNRDKSILSNALFGRKNEIRRLAEQILTGQSSVIVSVFEDERTALLGYLSDPSNNKALYGEQSAKLVFSLLDIHFLFLETDIEKCEPAQFWERALKPLENKLEYNSSLFERYQACQKNEFDKDYLDKLMVQLKQEGWRLVLMLDRFNELLGSNLDKPAFFATLRYLASFRSPSSLSLIISWDISLKQFHDKTKQINFKGSPYLNFMENGEIVLGLISHAEVDEWLRKMLFSKQECQFLKEIAGRHPHFIQLAASALQTAKENHEEQPLEVAKKAFYERVENLLTNIMHSWDSEICQAIVSLVKENKTPDLGELSLLEKQGFLVKDKQNQWQVSPQILVEFIQNKTEQALCNH